MSTTKHLERTGTSSVRGLDPLAVLGPLLACPACGDSAGLARKADHLACGACKRRFPIYGAAQVPWLFRDPEAARLEWRARFNGFLHANAVECSRLEAALRDRRLEKRAAERIRSVLDARAAQKREVLELLAPLSLGAPRSGPQLDRGEVLHGHLPRQQGLTSYYNNVFRDWSWDNGENEALLACVERVLSSAPGHALGKLLTLGAGSARLCYDVHRAHRPELTVALDLNPLLVLLASRVIRGETLAFHELPIAPLGQASFAVARSLRCPEPLQAGDDFVLVLADALRAPFKPGSFDTVLTPWLVDIVPQSFAECAAAANRALRPGGLWVNTGSLAFFHRNEAWCHSEEEALELVAAHGFELLACERATVPYLQSPASAHGRVERVLSFSARKIATCARTEQTPYLPRWLLESDRPIPDLDELVVASASHLLKATVLAAIDGRRTIDDIAALIAKRYGLQRIEAKGAVERILIEIHDAAALVSRDRLPELE